MNKSHLPKSGPILRFLSLIVRAIAVMMSLSGATGAPRAAAAADEAERWYVIKIGGNPAGYVREVVEGKGAGQFKTAPAERLLVTTSEMRLVLNRLGSRI